MAGFVGKRTEDLFLLGVAGGARVDLKGSDVCGMMILVFHGVSVYCLNSMLVMLQLSFD